jgi:predicted metal-dependent hydrolase
MTEARPIEAEPSLPRGQTAPLDPFQAERLFRDGVALFNGARYWHAHEAWETLWRAAEDEDRDFYQGLIQIAAGLLHLQRRNTRGARNKLSEGLVKLRSYEPAHRGIFVNELIGAANRILGQLAAGYMPHLIPPVIRFVESDALD